MRFLDLPIYSFRFFIPLFSHLTTRQRATWFGEVSPLTIGAILAELLMSATRWAIH